MLLMLVSKPEPPQSSHQLLRRRKIQGDGFVIKAVIYDLYDYLLKICPTASCNLTPVYLARFR